MSINRSRRPIQVGDRVRVRGIPKGTPEYDEGVVVSFTFGGARVHWSISDETYSEAFETLERIDTP